MAVRKQAVEVGYNLVAKMLGRSPFEAAADYNLSEVDIVRILVVAVRNNSAESSVEVVCTGKVGNLVVTVVGHILFVAVDSQLGADHNRSWTADSNIPERLIRNPSCLVRLDLVGLKRRWLAHSPN